MNWRKQSINKSFELLICSLFKAYSFIFPHPFMCSALPPMGLLLVRFTCHRNLVWVRWHLVNLHRHWTGAKADFLATDISAPASLLEKKKMEFFHILEHFTGYTPPTLFNLLPLVSWQKKCYSVSPVGAK